VNFHPALNQNGTELDKNGIALDIFTFLARAML
jgi:hypothetical protein